MGKIYGKHCWISNRKKWGRYTVALSMTQQKGRFDHQITSHVPSKECEHHPCVGA